MFVELLGRSCFSFLRGASHPEELIEQAGRLGLAAFALADLDGIYGAVRAWKAAQQRNEKRGSSLRFILGVELTLALPKEGNFGIGHVPAPPEALTLALLVESAAGYENLCRLLTKGHEGRDKGQCACLVQDVVCHARGLRALLVAPENPRSIAWQPAASESQLDLDQLIRCLGDAFSERLGLAIYRHLDGLDGVRQAWVQRLARSHALPIVASARPAYHHKDRKNLFDVMQCIRLGMTLDEAGSRLGANAEAHLRSQRQMLRLFPDYPQWVHESGKFTEHCHFDFKELRYHFPCKLEPGQTADERLAELTWEGVGRRYPRGIDPALRAQLKKELALIKKIGVAPYFLSTYDIVEIARRRKILCQGRGSAANSAVCYVLGITAVDPSRSRLLFERFLSEERAEPPDIDIDFEHERREEVIQEIYETYGRERAAMVSEVISYRGKSALREVGKVFGLGLEQIERLSGTVTWSHVAEAREKRLQEAGFDLEDGRVKQVVVLAEQLQGFPRHLSIHVGGFVLSSRPLYEVAPVEPARMEGRTVIPWDKDDIDDLGFFKVDVLALGMLTAIRKALELIVASGGLAREKTWGSTAVLARSAADEKEDGARVRSDFDPLEVVTRIPPEDPATYAMISRADTVGVFQIESRAQMAMLPRLRPHCFYDLVVEVAIVRPGPIQGGMVHPYLRRRNGEEPITSPHPDLWKILERTLGVPLFQEQVMQIAIEGAGYSGGEADQLRRDMAAWKKHGRLLRHRERLLRGFARKGIAPHFGKALFEQIKGFGEYGFPESHASSFALLVYASSWEKRHYPAHFACALLNSQPMGFYPPTSLVRDAQNHGVEVRDVCIVSSDWDSTLEPSEERHDAIRSEARGAHRALRLGLRLIKGLGKEAALRIVARRDEADFRSLEDLVRRARLKKDEVEALAEAGVLEALKKGRRNALWKARAPRTPGLFENLETETIDVQLPQLRPAQQLVLDYERKGLSVHDHPLRYYRRELRKRGAVRARELSRLAQGSRVAVAGLVMTRQRPATSSGVVFITLEDETASANLVVYSRVFEKYDHVARHAQLLLVWGHIERSGHDPPVVHVIVAHLERLERTLQAEEPMDRLRSRSRNFH